MALKSVFPTADDIPEGLSGYYTEADDGRFILDIEDVDAHPKVRGVITANTENKRKAAERQAKIEELTGRLSALPEDFDPVEWSRLKSGDKPDEQIQTLKEQHQRAVDAVKAKAKADLDALTGQLAERDGYIDGATRNETLRKALADAGFDTRHEPLLVDHLAPKIKVRRNDDGSRAAYVETEMGDVNPFDFVKEFATKQGKEYLAKASGPGAPGSNQSRGGGKTLTRAQFDAMDAGARHRAVVTEKMQIVD